MVDPDSESQVGNMSQVGVTLLLLVLSLSFTSIVFTTSEYSTASLSTAILRGL